LERDQLERERSRNRTEREEVSSKKEDAGLNEYGNAGKLKRGKLQVTRARGENIYASESLKMARIYRVLGSKVRR